jgi:tetratricopeptide (TPR) repeat protein
MDRRPTERTISWPAVGLVVLLAVLPYLNALTAGFTLDDETVIRTNPVVTRGLDPWRILASPMDPKDVSYHRPLTVLTYAINEAVAPGFALPFHAVNILLHAGVAVLVLVLASWLFESTRVPLIAAALFAIHPIHTEAVTSVVGRAELLCALFGLMAILSAARADAGASRMVCVVYDAVSLLAFSLAILSKESGLTVLPLIFLFRSACRREPLLPGMLRGLCSVECVPYVLCAAVLLALRLYVAGPPRVYSVSALDNVLAVVSWPERLRSALGILWDYFGLLNFPLMLAADYSYNQVPVVMTWADPRSLAGGCILIAALVVALRGRPALAFAAVLPFVALSLTSNLLFPIGTLKAERLLYLPSVGWALLLAYGFDRLQRLPRYRRAAVGALAFMGACFIGRTWVRNRDWQDNITLAHSMVASAPQSAKSLSNFGVALLKQGQRAAAIEQFQASLAIFPMGESAFGIATALNEQGQTDAAIEWLRKTLNIAPALLKAHTDLCHHLLSRDDFAAAARACRNGLRYSPADANLLKGLGSSLMGTGETEKAIEILHRSLALNPHDDELRDYLASLAATTAASGQG